MNHMIKDTNYLESELRGMSLDSVQKYRLEAERGHRLSL